MKKKVKNGLDAPEMRRSANRTRGREVYWGAERLTPARAETVRETVRRRVRERILRSSEKSRFLASLGMIAYLRAFQQPISLESSGRNAGPGLAVGIKERRFLSNGEGS